MRDLTEFMKVLGVEYRNQAFLDTALTHRSYLNENKDVKEHNERLEFLGDAVLELVVTEYLYNNYPNPEGELTNWRSALVKTETISDCSRDLGVEEYLLMSRGEAKSFGRSRQLLLANAFEAISGSIYLDQGYDAARDFITRNVVCKLEYIIKERLYIDAKSEFQELAQEKDGITPRYDVISEEGPDHNKKFLVGVFVGDTKWGEGTGSSKQSAQQAAAIAAVKKFKK